MTQRNSKYLQCLRGTTGCNLGSIMREAGRIDGALVGMDHKTRQALHRIIIPA